MKYYSNVFFLIIILTFASFMIINPRETVTAAADGARLWAMVVFPALFPFFVVAELLVSLRFVNFLGVLLEPIMRPLFHLPGCSSLVVVMGFTSGFPVGAILTRKLYDDNLLTDGETERLACFTNNSSPLFIIGAVGVGMFNHPWLGYLLALAHYLSNLLIGFGLRFLPEARKAAIRPAASGLWAQACQELTNYPENPPGPGKLLGEAIKNSLSNIMAVGGFIIIFAAFARMLTVWGLLDLIALGLTKLLAIFNLSYPVAYGIGMGIFEMTIGARTVAATQSDLMHQLAAVSGILAFSGFSIIAQVLSILAGTPVRLSFYLGVRIIQTILSIGLVMTGYLLGKGHPAIASLSIPFYKVAYSFDAWTFSLYCLAAGAVIILVMLLISLIHPQP